MTELATLVAAILEDGVIDEAEVGQLSTLLLADGVIDREEADALFELNDATSGKANHPSWDAFFVTSLVAHVLEDDESPGVVDEDEGAYLKGKIYGDGEVDANERGLIVALKAKATGDIPQSLQFLFNLYAA